MEPQTAPLTARAEPAPGKSPAVIGYVRSRWRSLRPILVGVILFNLLFNLPCWTLHQKRLLLTEFDLRAPYHFEPRFAQRHYLLSNSPGYEVIFTGDSRVELGINPDLIPGISSFNLGVGSQTIPMTEQIVLDSLVKLHKQPRFLAIGITPDYMSTTGIRDSSTAYLIAAYEKAEQFHRDASPVASAKQYLAPTLFYRDTVFRDLKRLQPFFTQAEPPRQVEGGIPLVRQVTWGEYFATYAMAMTPRGYNPDDMAVLVKGDYPRSQGVRPRLKAPYHPDREALAQLVSKIRSAKIEPIFLIMPLHDSFFAPEYHPGVREQLAQAVADVAQSAHVTLLEVPYDTTDPSDYWDGHHMSTQGAAKFTRALAPVLANAIAPQAAPK